jgi:hypothetical protein
MGSADNLAPNGLKHHMATFDGDRIPFAAHDPEKPEMDADGAIPGGIPVLNRVFTPHPNRRMQPERIPKEVFSFSGKPINHRLFYTGK